MHPARTPNISPTKELPFLLLDQEPICGTLNIIKYLKKNDLDLDYGLTGKQLGESAAIISMIQEKLNDVTLFSWWIVKESRVVQETYVKEMAWSTRYFLPSQYAERAKKILSKYKHQNQSAQIYDIARLCYKSLSVLLGDKEFFFEKPSTVDAFAFAYLACHLADAKSQTSVILYFEFPSLVAYVDRVKNIVGQHEFKQIDPPSISQMVKSSIQAHLSHNMSARLLNMTAAEIQSWTQIGAVIGFFVGYIWYNQIIRIKKI